MPIQVPFIEYHEVVAQADRCLVGFNPDRSIPVEMEDLIDVAYGIDLVLATNLETRFGTVAYISRDLREIRVDEYVYKRQSYRLAFSLAHELAHLVLHQHVYQQMQFATPEEWKAAMDSIPDQDYRRLEWQADTFAGLLLVPPPELQTAFTQIAQVLQAAGKTFRQLDKPAQDFAVRGLARQFNVASGTIWFRLYDDGLI